MDIKQVVKELKKPEVKERFKSIIVDTVDLAADYCQKYICNQLDIENIGDGGWSTNGWSKYKKEFEDTFRSITQLGYAVVFLSHAKEKTIKPKDGLEYQQICSSMQSSACAIIENMADLIGYAHPKMTDQGGKVVLTLRSSDNSIVCGGRFKYIASEIEFSYDSLTKALNDAIDREANETNNAFVTDEKMDHVTVKEYDHDALVEEFQQLVGSLMQKDPKNGNKIVTCVDKYLGKGKKVADTSPSQAELVYLIVTEIKEELM